VFISIPCLVPEILKCVEVGMVMNMMIMVVEMMALED